MAAVIVVLYHLTLNAPGVRDAAAFGARPGTVAATLTETPLKLLTSGDEAVLVFFVLSGIVVALPPLARTGFDWFSYVPHRLTRLMVPVYASIVLAVVLAAVAMAWPGWSQASEFRPFGDAIFQSFTQLDGPHQINGVLWTMMWELAFSLLLPVYVILAVISRRLWWIAAVAALVIVVVGWLGNATPGQNLPVFFLGTLIAVRLPEVRGLLAGRSAAVRHLSGAVMLVVGLILIDARWISGSLARDHHSVLAVMMAVEAVGAVLVVLTVLAWRPAERLLETRPVQWLGRISFSLYLVHVPIMYVGQSWLRMLPWWAWGAIVLVVAFVVAEIFARLVEQPAHRLSQRVRSAAHEMLARIAILHEARYENR